MADEVSHMIELDSDLDIWNKIYTVNSLVIVGSKEENGSFNFAPKHMAMPLGFSNYFGFMGTPRKSTYRNVIREKVFTVSYPQPNQLVLSSLMATRREEDDSKPVLDEIPTSSAEQIDGQFLKDSYLQLECEFTECLGKFGEWEIITGEIVAAYVHKNFLRNDNENLDDNMQIKNHPLLAYLHPNRFSIIEKSNAFPFPKDFKR